ncbi:MAG TPA: 3-oxoacyl-[acyl-carrier-protein] reductase [Phycisphaerae bacterium]|nr:3-oxoacyl-[acyl-carrier-protein] reductase [Phycisphaerae bacterium]
MAKSKSVPDDQKIAIVTGGSRGIGFACCKELLSMGMTVIAAARSAENLQKAAAELAGEKLETYVIDVADSAAVTKMIDYVVEKYGRLDVMVNNAGITRDQIIVMMEDADWNAVINVNLNSAFYGTREASKIMMRQRCGSVVNMSSFSGLEGNRGQANYAAAKAGMIAMSKSAAKELAKRNVRVNCVCPGFIETDMTSVLPQEVKDIAQQIIPMQRMGTADEIAKAVAFLASDASSYVTGQTLSVDGGMHM